MPLAPEDGLWRWQVKASLDKKKSCTWLIMCQTSTPSSSVLTELTGGDCPGFQEKGLCPLYLDCTLDLHAKQVLYTELWPLCEEPWESVC